MSNTCRACGRPLPSRPKEAIAAEAGDAIERLFLDVDAFSFEFSMGVARTLQKAFAELRLPD